MFGWCLDEDEDEDEDEDDEDDDDDDIYNSGWLFWCLRTLDAVWMMMTYDDVFLLLFFLNESVTSSRSASGEFFPRCWTRRCDGWHGHDFLIGWRGQNVSFGTSRKKKWSVVNPNMKPQRAPTSLSCGKDELDVWPNFGCTFIEYLVYNRHMSHYYVYSINCSTSLCHPNLLILKCTVSSCWPIGSCTTPNT